MVRKQFFNPDISNWQWAVYRIKKERVHNAIGEADLELAYTKLCELEEFIEDGCWDDFCDGVSKDEVAKMMIAKWYEEEYGRFDWPVEDARGLIPIAYTELGNENQYPVQVYVDLRHNSIEYEITDETGTWLLADEEEVYDDINDMIFHGLENLDFMDLISHFNEYIPEEDE